MWWASYIGIPFIDHGRTREGCDCWGLVRLVYKEVLETDLPSWNAYTDLNDLGCIKVLLEEALPKFDRLIAPEPFAIALMRSPSNVFHVGVMVDQRNMLHVNHGKDACVEPIERRYTHQLKGFYKPHDQNNCQT